MIKNLEILLIFRQRSHWVQKRPRNSKNCKSLMYKNIIFETHDAFIQNKEQNLFVTVTY